MAAFTYFSSVLGLKANLDKSHLVTGGIGNEIREHFLEIARFHLGTLPFKYLGMPGKPQRLNKQQCQILVDRIAARISEWPVKKLTSVD